MSRTDSPGGASRGGTPERFAEVGLAGLTLAGWAVVGYVVVALPVSGATEVVFYTAGFVALAGSTALALGLYAARARGRRSETWATAFLGTGMRFAFAVEFGLWLQAMRALTVWHVAFLAAGFLFVEFLFNTDPPDEDGRRR